MRLVLCSVALLAAAAAGAGATSGPRVALDGLSPVVVVGSGFEHGVAVRVSVASGGPLLQKRVRTSPTGVFTATWRTSLKVQGCTPVGITAVSAHRRATSRAVVSKNCGALRVPVAP